MRDFLSFRRAMLSAVKLPRLLLFSLLLLSTSLFAQVDKEFWFSIPHSSVNHGYTWPLTEGGKPIKLRVATLSRPATIVVSFPATTLAPLSIDLLANQQYTFDYLDSLRNDLTLSGVGNTVENKGILVQSTEDITAYLELACKPNPEIFSLKGTNALGTKFYTPFQTRWPNDTIHNHKNGSYSQTNYSVQPNVIEYLSPDSAFASIDIVATEDGTIVEITPNTDIVGCAKGKTLKVALNRGQVYSARAKDQGLVNGVFNRQASNLSGSLVTSNKKIAVIVRDDSVLPIERFKSGSGEDYIGDQLVPVEMAGKEFVIIKGQLTDVKDYIYVVGTENNTTFTVNGVSYPLNAGQTKEFPVETATSFVKVTSGGGVYVFHVTGKGGETSGAIIPSTDRCSGSDQIGFVRTYGSMKYKNYDVEQFYMNILVKKGGESGFMLDNKPLSSYLIDGSSIVFSPVSQAPEWVYTQIKFPRDVLVVGSHILSNTQAYFHMGFINTTIHNWKEDTSLVGDPKDIGANYGYFSNYKEVRPEIRVINTETDKFNTWACAGLASDISLKGQGGSAYIWSVYQLDKASGKWSSVSADANNFYFKPGTYTKTGTKIDAERPIIDKSIPIGSYKYVANITSKVSCSRDTADTVYINIEPCIDFLDTTNCFCESKAGTGKAECMNLTNMKDDILGKHADKFTTSGWFTKHKAITYVFDNFDGTSNVKYESPTVGAFATAANPSAGGLNTSATVGAFTGTTLNGGSTASLIYVPFTFKDANLLSLKEGKNVTLSVAASTADADMNKTISVALAIKTDNGIVATDFQDITAGTAIRPWQKMSFDLSKFDNTVLYSKMYFVIRGAVAFNKNVYFDDIQWDRSSYLVPILDATCHAVSNQDTVYTVVKSTDASSAFADTVRVINYIHAAAAGCSLIPLRDTICAQSTNCFEKYNLTRFTNSATTSLAARLSWYYDKALKQKVADSSNISYCSNPKNNIASFYLNVENNCSDHVDSLNVFVNPKAVVTPNPTATICSKPGELCAVTNLDKFKINVTKDILAKLVWYKDIALKNPIDGSKEITICNKDVFYARVYITNVNCYEIKTLTFIVKPTPKSDFKDTAVCINKFPINLVAKPSGVFSGSCVTSQGLVAAGITKDCTVKHLVEDAGCRDSSFAKVIVKSVPTFTIKAHEYIEYNTATQLNNVTVVGADTYQWADAANLVKTDVMQPETKILKMPTTFMLTATDSKSGCSDTISTIVPVKSTKPIVIVAPKVCLKDQITASVIYSGGYPPYTYKWTASNGATSADATFKFNASVVGKIDIKAVLTDTKGTAVTVDSFTVVNDKPVLADLSTETCFGVSRDLNIDMTHQTTSPYSFTWFGADVNNILTNTTGISTAILTTATRGQKTLQVMAVDVNGCKDTANVNIEIHGKPIVTINKNFTICNGQCKPLSVDVSGEGTPEYTFAWSNAESASVAVVPSPLSSASVQNPTFCATSVAKSYLQLDLTDKFGCKASDQITVDVKAKPEIAAIEGPKALCKNANSTVLSACLTSAGTAPYIYNWTIDDQAVAVSPASGESSCSNIIYTVPSSKNEQTISFSISDANGCANTVTHTITINPIPSFTFQLNPDSVCLKKSVTINAVSDDKTVTFKYGIINSGINYPIDNATFTPDKEGTYLISVTATNSFGCKDEKSSNLVVHPLPTVDLKDMDVCRLTCKYLSHTITGQNIVKYNWLLNGASLPGASVANPEFCAYATSAASNTVSLEVTDVHGCTASDAAVVTVREKPIASIDGAPMRYEIADKAFNLKASATSGNVPYSFEWTPTTGLTTSAKQADVSSVLPIGNSVLYSVYVTDSYDCKDTATIQINIEGQPKVEVKPLVLCEGDKDKTLEAIVYGGSQSLTYDYVWTKVGSTDVIGTDKTLKVPADKSETEVYKVVVTPKGNAAYSTTEDTALVTVNPAPVFTIDNHNKSKLCAGDTVKLTTVPESAYYYSWPDGLKFNNPYIVEARNIDGNPYSVTKTVFAKNEQTGCIAKKTISLWVNMLPQVSVSPSKSRVCTKDPAVLTANVTPAKSGYSYRWILNSDTISRLGKTYDIPVVPYIPTAIQTNNYQVKVIDDTSGCVQYASAQLDIVSRPKGLDIPNVCTGDNQPITIGLDEKVTWTTTESAGNWKLDITDPAKPTLTVINGDQAVLNYSLLKDGNECPLIDQKTVLVVKTPNVKIDDAAICEGKGQIFSVTPEDSVSYSWKVEGVLISSTNTLNLKDQIPGNKNITVSAERVNNAKTCRASDDAILTVHYNPEVKLSLDKGNLNVFAPVDDPAAMTAVVTLRSGSPLTKVLWNDKNLLTSYDETINGLVYKAVTTGDAVGYFTFSVEDKNGCLGSDRQYVSRYGKALVELFYVKNQVVKVDTTKPFNVLDYSSPTQLYWVDGFGKKPDTTDIVVRKRAIVCDKFTIGLGINSGDLDKFDFSWIRKVNGVLDDTFHSYSPVVQRVINDDKIYQYFGTATYKNSSSSITREIIIERVHFPNIGDLKISPIDEVDQMYYENTPLTLTLTGLANITKQDSLDILSKFDYKWSSGDKNRDTLFTSRKINKATLDSLSVNQIAYSYQYTMTSKNPFCPLSKSAGVSVKYRYRIPFKIKNTCANAKSQTVCVDTDNQTILNGDYKWSFKPADAVVKIDSNTLCLTFNPNKEYSKVYVTVQDRRDRTLTSTYPTVDSFEIFPEFKISDIKGKRDVCVGEISDYEVALTNESMMRKTVAEWKLLRIAPDTALHGKIIDSSLTDCDVKWKSVGQNEVYAFASYVSGYRCVTEMKIPVTVHDVVAPKFIHVPDTGIYSGTEVKFINLTYGPYTPTRVVDTTNIAFQWDFVGDGVYAAERFEPIYAYDHFGIFDVHLLAEDKRYGCKKIVSDTLVVKKNYKCDIVFPNTFMPEAEKDKTFSGLKQVGIMDNDFNLRVFNRWGQLLWETNDRRATWDGVYQGAISKQDVYVYHCKVMCEDGTIKNIKGDVTLLR